MSCSRKVTVEIVIQSLKILREMCEGNNYYEPSDAFIVRIQMMKNLVQIALNNSLKVSYLEEQKEYVPMADLLDDVYLQMPRKNLQSRQSIYRNTISEEYDSMRSIVDLMDERLKTIRIVCNSLRRRTSAKKNKRNNKRRTNAAAAKKTVNNTLTAEDNALKFGCFSGQIIDGQEFSTLFPTTTNAPTSCNEDDYDCEYEYEYENVDYYYDDVDVENYDKDDEGEHYCEQYYDTD
jgi:hypothetical protein